MSMKHFKESEGEMKRERAQGMRFRKRNESGQGMIEYGLVIGLISVWVVSIFLALRPMFTEQMTLNKIDSLAGEGRATLAADLNVNFPSDEEEGEGL